MSDGLILLITGAMLTGGLAASLLAGRLRVPGLVLVLGLVSVEHGLECSFFVPALVRGRVSSRRSTRIASTMVSATIVATISKISTEPIRMLVRGSSRTLGNVRWKCSALFQCVVAGRPSSSPAAASTKAPVQTDMTRAPRRWAAATAATASSWPATRSGVVPGTTTRSA